MDTRRQMMNLRVIRVSFRAAVESQGDQRYAAVERARELLRDARSQATNQESLDEITSADAEVEAALGDAEQREGS